MFNQVEILEVRIWGRTVGALMQHPRLNNTVFEYDPQWTAPELSPFLMPVSSRRKTWTFQNLSNDTFHGLPPLIAGSMPDNFGNAVIEAAILREGINPRDINVIDRLAYVGTRAMGALTFHPSQSPVPNATAVEMAHLVEGARRALRGSLKEEVQSSTIAEIFSVGVSAGGARAKAIIALDQSTDEVRIGGIDVPPGFEQWLLKFDGVGEDPELGASAGYGRIEYAYSLMAKAAGITMSECRLLEEGGRAHFLTRRFDRPGSSGQRLHMQSINDLLGLDYRMRGAHDYSAIFNVARSLGLNEKEQIFRRMVFNVLASNNDDHTKNHSFLMDEQGKWQISPAYDVTYAYNPDGYWTAEHLMSVNGRFANISEKDLLSVADKEEVPGAKQIILEVNDSVQNFKHFAAIAGIDAPVQETISERLEQLQSERSGYA